MLKLFYLQLGRASCYRSRCTSTKRALFQVYCRIHDFQLVLLLYQLLLLHLCLLPILSGICIWFLTLMLERDDTKNKPHMPSRLPEGSHSLGQCFWAFGISSLRWVEKVEACISWYFCIRECMRNRFFSPCFEIKFSRNTLVSQQDWAGKEEREKGNDSCSWSHFLC